MSSKFVYLFSEGNGAMRELLGGKGANLAEMTRLRMPVPQGFTITTDACSAYYANKKTICPEIEQEVYDYIGKLEAITEKTFGGLENPLLVSVRSGAVYSMPGMMDTILNLGLNDQVVEAFAAATSNPRFAYDSYRRLIQMYGDVVMEVPKKRFDALIDKMKDERGVIEDSALSAEDLKTLTRQFLDVYRDALGEDFPQDPKCQLMGAIAAVFRSWYNPRAVTYRRMHGIPAANGTAVTIQSMVFGNMGDDSGTGVVFSRNPSSGGHRLYGEFLINAQGEDVVAGIRTPQPIEELMELMPDIYDQLFLIGSKLERHYRDLQDMEFTIERGKLYMLQTRNGKRTIQAALKIAVDLVTEWLCTKDEALLNIDANQLEALLHPQFDPKALAVTSPICHGLAASPGAACGGIYFTADDCKAASANGPVILVRQDTSPEDIEGMSVSRGILTARGGMTSHAAVVARGMGICCISGCAELQIDEEAKTLTIGEHVLKEGDFLSLDGSTGRIFIGQIKTVPAATGGYFATIMEWSDEVRTLGIRANADNPQDSATARRFGAEGIGLARTEHMFFDLDRLPVVQEMILSKTTEQRERALVKLLPMQRADFEKLFTTMEGLPVTIRLLDPPLHEFLPTQEEDIRLVASQLGIDYAELQVTIANLHETNPMMGHRGCRVSVTYPEIAAMQARAIIEAAIKVKQTHGYNVVPEIMVPLIGDVAELIYVKQIITEAADAVIAEADIELRYQVGTMIELPRAALTADELARESEFFSFGTNDLTQMTFGLSRDDAARFLETYYQKRIFQSDPFACLDKTGVGKLVETAVTSGKIARPDLKLGVCGEHGADPCSVAFFHRLKLDYVSCSPYRIPIARLAAAQAAIRERMGVVIENAQAL